MRTAVIAVLALASPASADVRVGVHLGGGLEGGLITGAPHPGGVAEAGMTLEALVPGASWGFGLSVESVGRTGSQFDTTEELKIDATWRWASPNRRARVGVGGGMRALTFAEGTRSIFGLDLMRLDVDFEGVGWQLDRARVAVNAYVSWTFGCYSDSYAEMPTGDVMPRIVEVGCRETITTSYVIGLKTTVGWR